MKFLRYVLLFLNLKMFSRLLQKKQEETKNLKRLIIFGYA
jgi:hypothetical protein